MPTWQPGSPAAARLAAACAEWDERQGTRRLAERDATLWTGGDEPRWLDWLGLAPARAAADAAARLAEELRADGLTRVILVGMGGSSLAPEVFSRVFAGAPGAMPLTVLDTLDPRRIRAVLDGPDLARSVVVVASKSGSTLEPNLVKDVLLAKLRSVSGDDAARRHFVAITDPGSSLDREAREGRWRAVVAGVPGIGGRYSALSAFGIVPAVLLGVDVSELIGRAEAMRARCLSEPAEVNPGVGLGIALGTLAREGRDKLTILATPSLRPAGAWIEQLVAESTGKWGRGILPVDGEAEASAAGDDRVFALLRSRDDATPEIDARARRLLDAGHPVLTCEAAGSADLGALFYQWEIATAVAGAVLGINPFDQPDVESAKVAARARLSGEDLPDAPERVALVRTPAVTAEADARTAATLAARLPDDPTLAEVLAAHGLKVRPPGFVAVLAWRCEGPGVREAVERLRSALGQDGRVATTLGIGPRFLHSTGQLHKGGPNTGTFVQVIGPAGPDVPVPDRAASLDGVLTAQAEGDFDVLASRGRRMLLLRLGDGGAEALDEAVRALAAGDR